MEDYVDQAIEQDQVQGRTESPDHIPLDSERSRFFIAMEEEQPQLPGRRAADVARSGTLQRLSKLAKVRSRSRKSHEAEPGTKR